MVLIRSIIRPERASQVLQELLEGGYPGVTKMGVYGRGKQKGIKVGDVYYDELHKEMLLMVVEDKDKDDVIRIVMKNARTGENGNSGDGRIFVSPVEEAYTISSRTAGL